ncbi:MAG: hypothetical protein JO205_12715 [Pseudolabrys sp.]|nr:hypothetical protein [Pseudolabrys sp.]MBV9262224.1 hypothetical protein [Pseudolabrys sp.]
MPTPYPIPMTMVRHTGCQWVPPEAEPDVKPHSRPDIEDPEVKAPAAPACQPERNAPNI